VLDYPLDIGNGQGIDTGKRLIEEYEPRIRRQGARDLHPPPLAAGQAHAHTLSHMSDMQLVEEFPETRAALGLVEPRSRLQDGHDVVLHRHAPKYGRLLREVAHAELRPAVHGEPADVLVVEIDFAVLAAGETDDHVKGRGLAGPIGAEQPNDLAALHFERDVLEDLA
jgi:hypothetical protein